MSQYISIHWGTIHYLTVWAQDMKQQRFFSRLLRTWFIYIKNCNMAKIILKLFFPLTTAIVQFVHQSMVPLPISKNFSKKNKCTYKEVTIFQRKLQHFAKPFIFQIPINDTAFFNYANNITVKDFLRSLNSIILNKSLYSYAS